MCIESNYCYEVNELIFIGFNNNLELHSDGLRESNVITKHIDVDDVNNQRSISDIWKTLRDNSEYEYMREQMIEVNISFEIFFFMM
jgi:hypothetical protein